MLSKFSRLARTTRSRLALLVTACIVPSLVLSALLIAYHYHHEREHLVSSSISTVHSMSDALDRDLASVEAALAALSTSPHLKSSDLAAFHAQATGLLQRLNANNVYLVDSSGQQLLNTLRPFGAPLPRSSNMPLIREAFRNKRTVFSNLFRGSVARKPILAIGLPVVHEGKMLYMLGATIGPPRLGAILAKQELPEEWIGSIIDGSGTIVARTREAERLVGHKTSPEIYDAIRTAGHGTVEFKTLDGIPSIGIFKRSAVSHWTVAVYIPQAVLTQDLWRSIWLVLAIHVLTLSISLYLAWSLGGKIAGAMNSLIKPALALGRNEKVSVPRLFLKEADEVARALEKASELLMQTQHQAHHDELTGLANRTLLGEIVQRQLAICKRSSKQLAILYLDLDGFKQVNDTYGHAVGDELLRSVAARIQQSIRKSDIAFRLGGDEFATALIDTGRAGAEAVASKLVHALSEPYALGTVTAHVSCSIGIAVYPESADTMETLLQRADKAMYSAKIAGKGRYIVDRDQAQQATDQP